MEIILNTFRTQTVPIISTKSSLLYYSQLRALPDIIELWPSSNRKSWNVAQLTIVKLHISIYCKTPYIQTQFGYTPFFYALFDSNDIFPALCLNYGHRFPSFFPNHNEVRIRAVCLVSAQLKMINFLIQVL